MRDVGQVMSNPNKVRILEVIRKRGEVDMGTISKLTRIPMVMLRGLIEDLKRGGFIEEVNGVCRLTDQGLEVLMKIC